MYSFSLFGVKNTFFNVVLLSESAVVTGPILPGKIGRVRMVGSSWLVQSAVALLEIGQKMCILTRQGTSLLVMPLNTTYRRVNSE